MPDRRETIQCLTSYSEPIKYENMNKNNQPGFLNKVPYNTHIVKLTSFTLEGGGGGSGEGESKNSGTQM